MNIIDLFFLSYVISTEDKKILLDNKKYKCNNNHKIITKRIKTKFPKNYKTQMIYQSKKL